MVKMAVSKANQRAVAKYMKANYDDIKVRVPKGQREVIKAHADRYDNGSVNAFIQRAISEAMARDQANDCPPSAVSLGGAF